MYDILFNKRVQEEKLFYFCYFFFFSRIYFNVNNRVTNSYLLMNKQTDLFTTILGERADPAGIPSNFYNTIGLTGTDLKKAK